MDRASQVLAQSIPSGIPKSYRALADHRGVPRSTFYHRAQGRRSLKEKATSQQYFTSYEKRAFVQFLLQRSDFEQPIQIIFIPSLAFSLSQQRPLSNKPLNPPDRNWAKALERRYSILQARRVRPLDWNRHEKNIYYKVINWFEVIGRVLQDPAIVAGNVYNYRSRRALDSS